jgi:hypothetical protein
MTYYSHVLNIPHAHPFDNEHRWTTFLGEFVKPLVEGREFLFWFSYYGDFARFRIYTEDYNSTELDVLMSRFGFTYRLDEHGNRIEANATLEGDLGGERFLGAERTDVSSTERGLMVLRLVHAGAQLFLSTLVREGDYWREEICDNANNTYRSSSRSYIHLLHNLTQSPVCVILHQDSHGSPQVVSEYGFSYIQPPPHPHKAFRVHV